MGKAPFPSSPTLDEAIEVLNEANPGWNLSLVSGAGCIYIVAGDQICYTADNEQEARAFLEGCIFALAYESGIFDLVRKRIRADRPPTTSL